MDIFSTLLANLVFSARMAPLILVIVGLLRGCILLLGGRRREFEDWTRNKWMAALSWLFITGTILHMTIRYLVARLFFIKVNEVSFSTTYMEPNMILKVDSPPRTSIAIISLFVSSVLSVFCSFFLLFLPSMLLIHGMELVILLVCWWTAIGTLFNTSIRSGDISLIGASLHRWPKSGPVELCIVAIGLIIIYLQLWGMPL